jgi:hypothetical protein
MVRSALGRVSNHEAGDVSGASCFETALTRLLSMREKEGSV